MFQNVKLRTNSKFTPAETCYPGSFASILITVQPTGDYSHQLFLLSEAGKLYGVFFFQPFEMDAHLRVTVC